MDDAARAPQPQFSRSHDDAADAAQLAESLLQSAGPEPTALLESEQWESLPPAVRLEALLQIAWLAAERDDDQLVLVAASRALELEPADERALAIAEPLWLESEAFAELADHYALAATSAGTEQRARQLLERALHMLEGTPAAAPAMLGLSERLTQLPRLRDAEASLLAVLKGDGADAEAALLKLGERWLKDGRAREGALELPPGLSARSGDAALDVLERLFDQAEDTDRLAEVLQRRVEVAPSPLARGRALDKLAELERERRQNLAAAAGAWLAAGQAFCEAGEREDAERAYERLLDMMPEHLNAAARLVSLRAAAGDFGGVTNAFAVLLQSDAAARQAAELLLSVADDAERACAADELAELTDSVLWRLSPEDQELSQRLLRESARLYAAQDRDDEAAELYRRLIGDRAAAEDLRAFQALIDANPVNDWRQIQQRWLFEWRENHDADRAAVLLSWARFEETEVGDPVAAAGVLTRAAELLPDHAGIWQELARLRLAGGDGDGGLAAAEELRRLGRDIGPALLGSVLEHEPAARWAVDLLKLTLSTEGRWPELFELYDRAIAAASAQDRLAWLDEAAVAARDVAQDRARAVRYWEAYVELAAGDARVDLALERLYEHSGDAAALMTHLERRLSRSAPEQRPSIEERMAKLALELGAVGDALASIERLGASAPERVQPLLEAAFSRAAELWATPLARAAGQECARRLRAAYGEQAKPEQIARVLRAELSLPLELPERCARLSELSLLCERALGDLPAALEAARSAFAATLAEKERRRAEELAQQLGAWPALCDMYTDAADSELDAAQRRRLLRRAAEVATEQLQDPARAATYYEEVFEVEPAEALEVFSELNATDTTAFEALCRVLTRGRRFEQLARALRERAERSPDAALFSRLGRLQAEELDDPLGAIVSHLQASDARAAGEVFLRQPSVFGDDGARALDLAERLDAVGLPEGAARVLRHQLAHFAEQFPPARKPVQLALVRVLDRCGEREAAHELLTEAAKRYATDAEVQRACAAAAAARGDWDRAEQCYRTLLLLLHGTAATTTSLRRATVYVELAAIKRRRDDEPAAAQLVESGFEAALDNTAELIALVRALVAHRSWDQAQRAAVALLDREGDASATTAALEALAELRGSGRELPGDLLGRAESAAARSEAFAAMPEHSGLLFARLAFLPLADAQRLLAGVGGELASADAARARVQLARRLLELGSADASAEATELLQAAVRHPDAASEAWQLLARAWELLGDDDNLELTLDAWLERSPTAPDVLGRALELAVKRSQLPRALALFERVEREGAAPAPELTLRLAALCVSGGSGARAVELLRREAEREPKPLKRAALLVEAAELLRKAGDGSGAQVAASEARSLDPASAEATLLLAQLRLAAGDRDGALELLDAYAASKERRRGKGLSKALRLAADLRLQRDELGEALPLLVEAHQLDKTDLDTALLLGLLAIDLDRLETAASALRVLVAQRELASREGSAVRPRDFARGYLQLARIEQHHGKKTNAKRMALRALEENPHLASAQQLLDELAPH